MKKLMFLMVGLILSMPIMAQEADVPKEALDEILRRGNYVEIVDGIRDDGLAQILSLPEDDSHKWFISVITTKGCKYCETLKYDFAHDRNLQAWANVNNPKKSFTHYKVYDIDNPLQKDRFKNIKITAYPTILIQPPLNNDYGPSYIVVDQITGYDGNPKKLSDRIRAGITKYVQKYDGRRAEERLVKIEGFGQSTEGKGVSQRPPFLPPDPDEISPNRPNIGPPPSPDLNLPLMPSGGILGGLKQMFMGIVIVVVGIVTHPMMNTLLIIATVVMLLLIMKKLNGAKTNTPESKDS